MINYPQFIWYTRQCPLKAFLDPVHQSSANSKTFEVWMNAPPDPDGDRRRFIILSLDVTYDSTVYCFSDADRGCQIKSGTSPFR
jgi:hypothetical protein